jgi:hypothetical protein
MESQSEVKRDGSGADIVFMFDPAASDDGDRSYLIEIFRALRQELAVRIVIQNVLLAGTVLTSLVTCLLMAFTPAVASWLALCQVAATAGAALMWLHGGARTMQISAYLTDVLEPRLLADPAVGWESWHHRHRFRGRLGSRWFISTVGIFLASEVLTIAAAIVAGAGFRRPPLLLAAIFLVPLTALLLRHPRLADSSRDRTS